MEQQTILTTEQNDNTHNELLWINAFLFLCGAIAIAGITYLLCGQNAYDFIINGEPEFALGFNSLRYLSIVGLCIFSLSSYLVWLSKYTNSRPTLEIKENFITAGVYIFMFMLWALFAFGLNLPTAGFIVLAVTVMLGIYCVYRYYNSSITAGILSSLWEVWLMYILVLNLAYIIL